MDYEECRFEPISCPYSFNMDDTWEDDEYIDEEKERELRELEELEQDWQNRVICADDLIRSKNETSN